jgi:hypothetical protein
VMAGTSVSEVPQIPLWQVCSFAQWAGDMATRGTEGRVVVVAELPVVSFAELLKRRGLMDSDAREIGGAVRCEPAVDQ